MTKKISLSVRDFALPSPLTGSIDVHSGMAGLGRPLTLGMEIHQKIQKLRVEENPGYLTEVSLSQSFERGGFLFEVSGRLDGLFPAAPSEPAYARVHIEEIKSSFNIRELKRVLLESNLEHPYCLQLRTYGYFHTLSNPGANPGQSPKLSFHLVSTRNSDSDDLEIDLEKDLYESWLERRLDELVEEARRSEKRSLRRLALGADFTFPFDQPRPGQVGLIETVERAMKDDTRLLVQAPTGLGKTTGVLFPSLREALSRGQRVVYVTPKNSQHLVAEDAIQRFHDRGSKVKSLTLTAKSKICFKAEPLCNPSYCEYAKDYYTKLSENKVLEQLAKKKKLKLKHFQEMGEKFQVCPFELQLDSAKEADTVICDYNYVFAPSSSFGRLSKSEIGQEGKPNLLIDEAHNLPARAMDYYSPTLSSLALENMREEIEKLPARFRGEAEELLDLCIEVVGACQPKENPGAQKAMKIDPPAELLLEQDSRLRSFLSRYLESDVEIKSRDVVLRLCFYWSEFTSSLEFVSKSANHPFFTTFQMPSAPPSPRSTFSFSKDSAPRGGTLKITCCDPSEMLQDCYDEFDQVVGFSATLKPFKYYAKLSGLDPDKIRTAEFQSPFQKENRKLLIIPQISTKYSERERNYPKIAQVIEKLTPLQKGNYFVFFPSFDFLERVLDQFQTPEGFSVFKQERNMKSLDIERVIETLRSQNEACIVFAVQGGVFSEGVDYPGKMIIGAFVVGPPLPSFDLEREEMRKYYDKHYGSGFDYAYTYPAMAKAIQAAGRVIRSETDRGLIVLMDQRFIQPSYTQSMPKDWFDLHARELVSEQILKEVTQFWTTNAQD